MEITREEIRKRLIAGHSFFTTATAMASGGSHRWWMNEDTEEIYKFGSGPNWSDQDADFNGDLDVAVESLYNQREFIESVEIVMPAF